MNHFSVEKLCGFILKWSWPSGYPSIYLDYEFICSTILSVSPPHCLHWCFYTRNLVNIKICLDCHTLVNFSSITRLFQGVWNRLKRHVSTPPQKNLKKSHPPTWRSNPFHPLWHVALPLSLHSEGIALKNLGASERVAQAPGRRRRLRLPPDSRSAKFVWGQLGKLPRAGVFAERLKKQSSVTAVSSPRCKRDSLSASTPPSSLMFPAPPFLSHLGGWGGVGGSLSWWKGNAAPPPSPPTSRGVWSLFF